MKRKLNISEVDFPISNSRIQQFCEKWEIVELNVFGSFLRNDFDAESDIDLLVTFSEKVDWSLFDQVKMEGELKKIFGRDVDLISRKAVENSENWVRRSTILRDSKVIYAA